ncbi:MAG: hypothetical protein AABX50_00400 [Nanoarchaeota archaeon]
MDDLVLEGKKYTAVFQHTQRYDDSSTHEYTCWNTRQHMWWEGRVRINDKVTTKDVRAFFETFHRSDVPEGIRDETLEESLLLVRGMDEKGNYVSHRGGGNIITNRNAVIDYLLGKMYESALSLGKDEVFPKIDIPLLEQSDLAERGYALGEPVSAVA